MGIAEILTWIFLLAIFIGLIIGTISIYNNKLSDQLVSFFGKVTDNIGSMFAYIVTGIIVFFFIWMLVWNTAKDEYPGLANSINTVYCYIPLPDWVDTLLSISCN